ncbi:U4/U6 small nuclear ribonucleoprotein Prp3 [Gryllus bimaculatus]|nr:U4/U6 small nuclear ribonucleoprotein Prp3 [Gryllus bimaculatus]
MTSYLSKKEFEEMKPYVDKTVQKFLGFSEPSLVTAALNCLNSGYDKKKTTSKLASLLDEKKAARLAERIFDMADEIRGAGRGGSRKRHHDSDTKDSSGGNDAKKVRGRESETTTVSSANPSPGQLTALQIKEMMANAQKMIEERKRALNALRVDEPPSSRSSNYRDESVPLRQGFGFPATTLQSSLLQHGDVDKARKIAQLQAQIQSKLTSGSLSLPAMRSVAPEKPTPLILDAEGRTVDLSGKEVQLTQLVPTLKANIRAKKREEFRQQLQERAVEDLSDTRFFDPRVGSKPAVRGKRALRFHEPGKFQQLAERMRMKAQLERLQNEISQIARKTGISSATKLALMAPRGEALGAEDVPKVEWWDSVLVGAGGYPPDVEQTSSILKAEAITHLVEHPTQMRPPTDPLKPAYLPVFLTKKERKKLRRQNRREAWKEEQEKIRLGLEPPPEPKLRLSNLMRVLGTEATQDPTRVEAHVRAQMLKRQRAHEQANAARRLTAEQRRDKKTRRLQEDTSLGVCVCVYRVKELTNASKKFKVETNAKQLFLTGCVVLFRDCNVVVVEGGPKQLKKYKRLMMNRIKWEEDTVRDPEGVATPNKCHVVWEGMSKQRNFGEVIFKVCPSERLARDHFKKHNVEHYWDLAYSGAILETSQDA